jgi:DNA repair protein RadD
MIDFDLPPLREYQVRAHAQAQRAVRQLRRAKGDPNAGCGILIQGPTGSGKTRQALEIIRGAARKGKRALVLAPRTELVDQPFERLWSYGVRSMRVVKHGRVDGDPNALITIASIQTLLARDFAPDADIIVFDEARHYVAPEWNRIAGRYATAVRVGLDATPIRTDGSALGDLFDRIVVTATVEELQRDGFLVPVATFAPDKAMPGLSQAPEDFYFEHLRGRPAIVFCQNIAHSKAVAERLQARGAKAMHVDGETPKDDRKWATKALRFDGDLDVITNVNLFLEGVDIPDIEGVIVARGCASESAWLQMGGRGMRPSRNKLRMVLGDLRGHMWTFGLLDEERSYHLEGSAIRRSASAMPSVVQCRECHAWGRGGNACASCRAELPAPPPPRITPAELREQRKSDSDQKRWHMLHGFVAREIAAGRNGWRASHIYAGVYGERPSRDWLLKAIDVIREAQQSRKAVA